MLLELNSQNPSARKVQMVADTFGKGSVIIYPKDSVYGLGCDIFNQKAVERICRLRNLNPKKAHLSFICNDISQIAKYAHQIDNEVFKLMKRNFPGAFTFVLKSNNEVPKLFKNNKRTVGVRIPDNRIVHAIVEELGHPILTTSLKSDDEILEYFTDPIDIYDDFKKLVDVVIDGGIGGNVPSTVVDCTDSDFVILREGVEELS